MSALTTDTELADRFKITVEKLHELRKKNGWPVTRLGRFEFRFTEEQVARIIEIQTVGGERPAARPTVSVPGQTARSAARRRSA